MTNANTVSPELATKVTYKRHALLQRIRRRGRTGRLELARSLRISNSRVCELVQQLLDESLLIEHHEGEDRRGRRGVPIMVNAKFGHILGFDMEARRMRLIVVDFAGQTVWQTHRKMGVVRTRQGFIDRICRFIEAGLEQVQSQFNNLLGIGLAVSGLADVENGVILRHELIKEVSNIPLRDLVSDRFGLPCVMEDNIRALTLAEWKEGAAQDMDNFVCLAVRTGVSAGIVINRKLYTGSHGFAGEAGRVYVPIGSSVNHWKYFEKLVSEDALGIPVEGNGFALSEARAHRAGELLGGLLANMATLLDPQAFVLAGDLVQPDGPLWDHAERTFRRLVIPELVDRVQLRPARLGPFAAAIGATHKCFQMLYPKEPMKGAAT